MTKVIYDAEQRRKYCEQWSEATVVNNIYREGTTQEIL